jgi:protein-disulfide isomerase
MGAANSAAPLAGIPQHRTVLGSPIARVTPVEYADLQCPYCGEFSRNALPSLIADWCLASDALVTMVAVLTLLRLRAAN